MKCVCTKCGRKNEVSVADLRLQHGVVVCPQCLSTFKVPIPKGDDDMPPPVPKRRKKTEESAKTAASQPKTPMKSSSSTAPHRTPTTKRTTSPRSRKKPAPQPHDSVLGKMGCLAWTVGITFGFFLLYFLLGLLTN